MNSASGPASLNLFMDDRIRQWLLWVGNLYQEIVRTGQGADAVITRRMHVEGRRWGHDARRWVSTTVYSLARSRVRTLWMWAAGMAPGGPLRQAFPDICVMPHQYAPPGTMLLEPLDIGTAVHFRILPERFAPVGEMGGMGDIGTMGRVGDGAGGGLRKGCGGGWDLRRRDGESRNWGGGKND